MKKKVAFFVNGRSGENTYYFLNKLIDGLKDENVDIFTFLGHATYSDTQQVIKCENAIYDLPDMESFDAVIVFGTSLNFVDEKELFFKCIEKHIPTISIGATVEGCISILSNNEIGMRLLVEHLIEVHNAKKIYFIAGPQDHRDSQIRENAVKAVMEKKNLPFTQEDIFYSNWDPTRAVMHCKEKFTRDNLPDAIVCANDILAEAVSNGLMEEGIYAPNDVMITGYDFTSESQIFYPSISSVKQGHSEMGEAAASILKNIFNGKKVDDVVIVPSSFIKAESCGCKINNIEQSMRIQYLRQLPGQRYQDDVQNSRLHEMEVAISVSEKFYDLPRNLQKIFYNSEGCEGNSFHILLDPLFAKTGLKDIEFPEYSFSKTMDIIVSKENGIPFSTGNFKVKDLIPSYFGEGQNHLYVFMPLYIDSFVCGYMIMQDHLEFFKRTLYFEFAKRFNKSLEYCRKNMQLNILNAKLAELMQKDALTSVKNRIAYEQYLEDLKEEFDRGHKKEFAIVMCDVNNLKKVNDELGHERGDEYLKNSCKMICNYFKHSPVFRIGGDEFVAILAGEDYPNREALLEEMRRNMEDLKDAMVPLEERISIATGMAVYELNMGMTIAEVVKQADERMYDNKFLMKNGNIR